MTNAGVVGEGVAYRIVPVGQKYPVATDDGHGYTTGIGSRTALTPMLVLQRGQGEPMAFSLLHLRIMLSRMENHVSEEHAHG